MSIVIQHAEIKDSEEVFKIFQSTRSQMSYLPAVHTIEETKNFIYKLVKSKNVLIAKDGNKAAGFIYANDSYVEHLYVHPNFQNKGVGKLLLDYVKTENPNGLYLWVFEENKDAIRFYEREGFTLKEKRDITEAKNEEGLPDRKYFWRK